ncbi:MAG: lytic transglycosylase domain-containing protein [Deltaproteobacteria bacterium]|nr:lytic transglycosylase domain-containing protein [Deltaproteobacteria bacterium]
MRLRLDGVTFAFALCLPLAAHADRFYCWVDTEDTVHCTDSRPPRSPEISLQVVQYGHSLFFPVDLDTYDEILRDAAAEYDLPFAYLKAIAKVESNFKPDAVSRAQAKGIMQLIDSTAALVKLEDPFDPRASIYAGARYLRILANRFDNDLALTAAAYNAGPERVKRAKGIPPIRETQRYVERVLSAYQSFSRKG